MLIIYCNSLKFLQIAYSIDTIIMSLNHQFLTTVFLFFSQFCYLATKFLEMSQLTITRVSNTVVISIYFLSFWFGWLRNIFMRRFKGRCYVFCSYMLVKWIGVYLNSYGWVIFVFHRSSLEDILLRKLLCIYDCVT